MQSLKVCQFFWKVSPKHRLTKKKKIYGIISELDNLALQITLAKDLIANGMMAR